MNSFKLFTALALVLPLVANAETSYEACARNEGLMAQFYHSKHVGLFDSMAESHHRSAVTMLEDLKDKFRSNPNYMNGLKELVETDVDSAAEILDAKMARGEKPFNTLRDFENEHGILAYSKSGAGASIGWTEDKELSVELCNGQDLVGENWEVVGKTVIHYGIRVCTTMLLVPKKMSTGGYRFVSKIDPGYSLSPFPDRKVIKGDTTYILKSVDQFKGIPIMPMEEYKARRIEEKCGKEPQKRDVANINFDERGNNKAYLSDDEVIAEFQKKRMAIYQ